MSWNPLESLPGKRFKLRKLDCCFRKGERSDEDAALDALGFGVETAWPFDGGTYAILPLDVIIKPPWFMFGIAFKLCWIDVGLNPDEVKFNKPPFILFCCCCWKRILVDWFCKSRFVWLDKFVFRRKFELELFLELADSSLFNAKLSVRELSLDEI